MAGVLEDGFFQAPEMSVAQEMVYICLYIVMSG